MAKPYSCHIDTTLQVYMGYVIWFPCADPYASSIVSTWQPYGIAVQKPHACHMAGIWLCHMAAVGMAYRRHMAKPYAFCMVSIQYAYGFVICLPCGIYMGPTWLNHINAICIPHGRLMAHNVISICKSICFIYVIHIAPIWFRHIDAICILHSRHMAVPYARCTDAMQKAYGKPYVFCMVSIQHAYGFVICVPCGIYVGPIWLNHIAAISIPHGSQIRLHRP